MLFGGVRGGRLVEAGGRCIIVGRFKEVSRMKFDSHSRYLTDDGMDALAVDGLGLIPGSHAR